ncbi:PTS system transcriptional activator [Brochothrix thermosphacta]|uniref:sigma-54-dependent transcriptional regulator n=1 Tax=Brochothrix thermosphacta TaxID=2756 RepID=UPI000D0F1B33|nr:sigma-54-dependent transcriptional regulator [Brochothrix thermosphacta]SOC00632.1 PTS system transcriptional activator [Brochothrix thermosphacta]
MKRNERILAQLEMLSVSLSWNDLKKNGGITALQIAESVEIQRNNVSADLNQLFREHKLIKINGRPVGYLSLATAERLLGTLPEQTFFDSLADFIALEPHTLNTDEEKTPFSDLIGADSSLRNQVEQAKAAILYPPNGLDTLIVGQTGVGKTLFANMMFNYARHIGKYSEDAPFIVFNCADYYTNPQLLMSHLFGHVKGAFTGADSDKRGLVEKAHRGILFLDEVHRLPPEGQEMIFYLMDNGGYAKLGETERTHHADVLIICATTENPDSSLLKTFVRRIPIIITIPTFEERSAKDKIDLLRFLLTTEAHRIKKPIEIDTEATKALIGNTTYGNVGQLKSNIQLVCANAFLHSLREEKLSIRFKDLPAEVKNGFFHLSGNRVEMQELSDQLQSDVIVMPDGKNISLIKDDAYEPDFNLYSIIEDKVGFMVDQGIKDEEINRFIGIDIDIHLNSFYEKFQNNTQSREKMLKVINEDILNFTENIKSMIEESLRKKLDERFILAFGLHLTAFLKRNKEHKIVRYANIENVVQEMSTEYELSLQINQMIKTHFSVSVPMMETLYLTLLINSLLKDNKSQRVAILVAMHGSSTASSMVNVVKTLLGESNIRSIDMPLDLSPKKVLDDMRTIVREIDTGKGVLLMVDMGSLTGFGDILTEETGIPVKTIDMVSTPTVLEAVRKATIMEMELDTIYCSLKDFRGYDSYLEKPLGTATALTTATHLDKPTAILSVCTTGEGTALKLQSFLGNILDNMGRSDIEILVMPLHEVAQRKEELERYNIVVSVGIANPNVGVPFIPLEQLFDNEGEDIIAHYLTAFNSSIQQQVNKPSMVLQMSEESLNEFLTYLNPSKILPLLRAFIDDIELFEEINLTNGQKINMMVHIGCALERCVLKETLTYYSKPSPSQLSKVVDYQTIALLFSTSLQIKLPDSELFYLMDMIENVKIQN